MTTEPQESGFTKVLNAALSEIPRFLTSIVVAIAVFQFGLWIDIRDLKGSIQDCRNDVCDRIQKCPGERLMDDKIVNLARFDNKIETDFYSYIKEDATWRARLIQLEDRIYNSTHKSDFFPNSSGLDLEHRVDDLENKK